MAAHNESLWGSFNTCFEIGLEIYGLMQRNGEKKGNKDNTDVQKIADGVMLMSDDKDILLAVDKTVVGSSLSNKAVSYGINKRNYLCYGGAAAAIPLYELSQMNENIRDYIVSMDSLFATLCGDFPEYVREHNKSAAPESQIKDRDAPTCLFLQKQLDLAADETRSQVAETQLMQAQEVEQEQNDELEV